MLLKDTSVGSININNSFNSIRKIKEQEVLYYQNNDNKKNLVIVGCRMVIKNDLLIKLSNDFELHQLLIDFYALNWELLLKAEIIFIDLNSEGLELGQIIKNHPFTSSIPLIFIANNRNQMLELKALSIGAIDIIVAPFNYNYLRYKVLNIIKHLTPVDHSRLEKVSSIKKKYLASHHDGNFLKSVVHAIQDNIDDVNLTVETLSHSLSQSSNYLYRRIKKLTGLTAKQFIITERLKTSALLLKETNNNISEVGYMVGFQSPGHFSKSFRKYYQCSPKEFKELNT